MIRADRGGTVNPGAGNEGLGGARGWWPAVRSVRRTGMGAKKTRGAGDLPLPEKGEGGKRHDGGQRSPLERHRPPGKVFFFLNLLGRRRRLAGAGPSRGPRARRRRPGCAEAPRTGGRHGKGPAHRPTFAIRRRRPRKGYAGMDPRPTTGQFLQP